MKYSIIMPIYNTEKYIKKCLTSIINQTYKNFELIIINDGSTDDSMKIVKEFSKDKRIKIFNKKNTGQSDSRNIGFLKSTGDYIIFIDSDDYISTSLLEKINKILNEQKVDVLKYDFSFIKNNKEEEMKNDFILNNLNGPNALVELIKNKKTFDMTCIYAFNRNFWKENNFKFPIRKYYEDFALIPIIILKAKKVSTLNETLYYYVQRNGSVMNSSEEDKFNTLLNIYDSLKSEYDKLNIKDKTIKKYFYSYISNALISRVKISKNINYIKELKTRKVFDNLMDDTLKRKIKKTLLKLYPSLFIQYM